MKPRATFRTDAAERPSTYVAITFKSGVLTIRPAGPGLGEREVMIIAGDVREALAQHSSKLRAVVLELSDVQIMSSFGLGWCIEVRNTVRVMNVKTVIFGLTTELLALFRMMKVEKLYTIAHNAGDLASAIAA